GVDPGEVPACGAAGDRLAARRGDQERALGERRERRDAAADELLPPFVLDGVGELNDEPLGHRLGRERRGKAGSDAGGAVGRVDLELRQLDLTPEAERIVEPRLVQRLGEPRKPARRDVGGDRAGVVHPFRTEQGEDAVGDRLDHRRCGRLRPAVAGLRRIIFGDDLLFDLDIDATDERGAPGSPRAARKGEQDSDDQGDAREAHPVLLRRQGSGRRPLANCFAHSNAQNRLPRTREDAESPRAVYAGICFGRSKSRSPPTSWGGKPHRNSLRSSRRSFKPPGETLKPPRRAPTPPGETGKPQRRIPKPQSGAVKQPRKPLKPLRKPPKPPRNSLKPPRNSLKPPRKPLKPRRLPPSSAPRPDSSAILAHFSVTSAEGSVTFAVRWAAWGASCVASPPTIV